MPGRQVRGPERKHENAKDEDVQGDLERARQNFLTAVAGAFAEWAPGIVATRLELNAERCTDDARASVEHDAQGLSGGAADLAERHLGEDVLWPHRRAAGGAQLPQELDADALRGRVGLLMGEVGRLLIDSGVEPRVTVPSSVGVAPRPSFGPRGSQAWRTGATHRQAVSWTGSVLWTDDMQAAVDEYAQAVARARSAPPADEQEDGAQPQTPGDPGQDAAGSADAHDDHQAGGDEGH